MGERAHERTCWRGDHYEHTCQKPSGRPRETAARALHDEGCGGCTVGFDGHTPPVQEGYRQRADAVLAAVAAHDGLAEVLRRHQVAYHSITGTLACLDPGCAYIDRNVVGLGALRVAAAAHLADVVRAWMVQT